MSEPPGGYGVPQPAWDDTTVRKYVLPAIEDAPYDYASPEADTIFKIEKTHPVYRYVHLQRLANPLEPWNANTNPYITVDTAAVDLTVFNSEANTAADFDFFTRQRGETDGPALPLWKTRPLPLWKTRPAQPAVAPLPDPIWGTKAVTNHVFGAEFSHSLGYLNGFYGAPLKPADFNLPTKYRGAPIVPNVANPAEAEPAAAPWLTWLNRPFAAPLELLQVPATTPSQLLMSFEHQLSNPGNVQQYKAGEERFGHLLSFFAALDGAPSQALTEKTTQYRDTTPPPANMKYVPPHLYRLLEYVHVPSRFLDAHIHGNPKELDIARGEDHAFHPPNHLIPTYREPGKINLNTIFDQSKNPKGQRIWEGLANDHPRAAWLDFVKARRGFDSEAPGPIDHADYLFEAGAIPLPTRFANPFRSFAGGELVPPLFRRGKSLDPARDRDLAEIARGGIYQPGTPPTGVLPGAGVNATLLRNVITSTIDDAGASPFFTQYSSTEFYNDTRKNPFFQYQSLQRLSNLVTTRSNVYAVWITVGYFEVEKKDEFNPASQAHIYPEGYTFGQELGIDTGEVKRHRGFYIIDRSIPVGFMPGKILNAENAVLLKRFIE